MSYILGLICGGLLLLIIVKSTLGAKSEVNYEQVEYRCYDGNMFFKHKYDDAFKYDPECMYIGYLELQQLLIDDPKYVYDKGLYVNYIHGPRINFDSYEEFENIYLKSMLK
jgi:hypothetical protein